MKRCDLRTIVTLLVVIGLFLANVPAASAEGESNTKFSGPITNLTVTLENSLDTTQINLGEWGGNQNIEWTANDDGTLSYTFDASEAGFSGFKVENGDLTPEFAPGCGVELVADPAGAEQAWVHTKPGASSTKLEGPMHNLTIRMTGSSVRTQINVGGLGLRTVNWVRNEESGDLLYTFEASDWLLRGLKIENGDTSPEYVNTEGAPCGSGGNDGWSCLDPDVKSTRYSGPANHMTLWITGSSPATQINIGGSLKYVTWVRNDNGSLTYTADMTGWLAAGMKVENGVNNPIYDADAGAMACPAGQGWSCTRVYWLFLMVVVR